MPQHPIIQTSHPTTPNDTPPHHDQLKLSGIGARGAPPV
nr:hypothetical protein [Kibdelosporangium sp. MJ126-NF4]